MGMLCIWSAIPPKRLLPVNSIATVKIDFREGGERKASENN